MKWKCIIKHWIFTKGQTILLTFVVFTLFPSDFENYPSFIDQWKIWKCAIIFYSRNLLYFSHKEIIFEIFWILNARHPRYEHFTQVVCLQINLCEIKTREHKFKRRFCSQKTVLNVCFRDFWYTENESDAKIYILKLLIILI